MKHEKMGTENHCYDYILCIWKAEGKQGQTQSYKELNQISRVRKSTLVGINREVSIAKRDSCIGIQLVVVLNRCYERKGP